ncbi:uncharacterized protein CLUP02_06228 [Colletotrichum lupini]|uniref:Uncharacterized protein n=1 Tax=Colletotrichum lupini TaxID=145971 RepID=A0A9Q8SNW8_9PEZI|nr:uncharacterized protein CLUP02_06228 [Colletotrichum lupini]KAK1714687.1 hypothetical protein BDP67DRAFT_488831 [Colletotrichum lupini]UQC80743.1 hypothetical protein CLUP02_06228 [Colletotrichum lupini]
MRQLTYGIWRRPQEMEPAELQSCRNAAFGCTYTLWVVGSCVLRCGSNKQEAGSSKWYEFAAKGKVRWAKERGGTQHLGRRRLKRELGGPLNAKLSVVGVCFPFNADLSGGALAVQFRRQGSRA